MNMGILSTYKFAELETDKEKEDAYRKCFAAYTANLNIVRTMVHLAQSYMPTDGS